MFDVLLIDGRHVMWRSADAFSNLSIVRDGERQQTGAVFGFLSVLTKVKLQFGSPKAILIVCWEGGRLKRRKLFPDYKKKSDLIPPERLQLIESIQIQQGIVKELMSGIGVPQAFAPGWEADDVMGSIAERWESFNVKIGIFTGDRDLLQCLTKKTSVIRPLGKGEFEVVTRESFEKEFQIHPRSWPFVKALSGDPGDNVPGVRGFGKVKALQLVQRAIHLLAGTGEGLSLESLVEVGRTCPGALSKALECEFGNGRLQLWLDLVRIKKTLKPKFEPTDLWSRKELARRLMLLRFHSWNGRVHELMSLGSVKEEGRVSGRKAPNQKRNRSA